MAEKDEIRQKREGLASETKHKMAKIISSLIPGGSGVYELLTAITQPLYEKRIEEWRADISMRLVKLEKAEKVSIKALSKNDEFVSLVTKASLDAIQFHQKEKLKALKAIIVNSALRIKTNDLNYEEQNMFLRIVERLDATQFIMLKLFHKPRLALANMGKPELINSTDRVSTLFLKVFPDLKDKTDLLSQMWADLHQNGLVSSNSFSGTFITYPGSDKTTVVTGFGERFLKIIELPSEEYFS